MVIETLNAKKGRYIDTLFDGGYFISEENDGDIVKLLRTTSVWAMDKLGILIRDNRNGGVRILNPKSNLSNLKPHP